MRDEFEEPGDDLNIEITGLDEGKSAGHAPRTLHLFARRHRRSLSIVTIGMVVLALSLIAVNTPAVRGLAVKVLAMPTPAPTQAMYPGEDLFYIQTDPAWGHLAVDGRTLTRLPIFGTGAPLRLGRGQHELVWSVEPFQQQHCILTVPANYLVDTCVDHATVQIQPGIVASIVEFRESLTTLAPERRAALVQAIQDELNARQSTVIVPKGELYALPPGNGCRTAINEVECYGVAAQPLYATLHFQLETDAASNNTCLIPEPGCTYLRENCFTFCAVDLNAPGEASQWNILAPVLPLWTFQKQDGSVIERDVPDNINWDLTIGELADESLIEMHITWQDAAWVVNIPAIMYSTAPVGLNPVCVAAQNVVGILQPPVDSFGEPLYLQWQYVSGLVPASGCLEVGVSRLDAGVNSSGTTPPGLAYCLLRFGVLLAVNDEAHRFWPNLPLADAYEQGLAQQLATSITGNT